MIHQAIPTLYNGVQFRSRLEANWAAFFDELHMQWLYEPFDLAGYIPDFDVERAGLIEVKGCKDITELHQYAPKVLTSGWDKRYCIVGSNPRAVSDLDDTFMVGLAYPKRSLVPEPLIIVRCVVCRRHTFAAERSGCLGCGKHDWRLDRGLTYLWKSAANATRWKPCKRDGSEFEVSA